MRLISPNGLWFLMLVPVLVLMYILKQRYEERKISSLYLWQQVIMELDAASPFQRLKRNLLFFLQLLVLLLCIFALTNPFIWWKNNNYQNIVLVVDTSGSMSAAGEKDTKLEEAKLKAEELVNSLAAGTRMTLVSAGKDIKVEITGSTDKKELLARLKKIKPTNSAGSITDTFSLVKAICDQYQSYKAVYFTDHNQELKGLNGELVVLGPQRPNVSLDYIAETRAGSGLKVMIRVTNHGTENTEAELCLYGEESLISIKNEALNAGETKTVYFDNVPADNKYIYCELSKEDGLLEDNRIFSVIKQKQAKRILMSTDQNIFMEKALNTLKDVEVFKTITDRQINEEFDLYIFDGNYMGKLPQKGNLLFLNPRQSNSFFKVGDELAGGKAAVTAHAITKYLNNSDFTVSSFNSVEIPYWASPLMKINEKDAAFAGEFKGQKVAVIGFDLHNSDFPLTLEFPIFVNNLISYLMDRDTMANTKYNCGEDIDITPLPETEKIFVKDPEGISTELSSNYPVKPFDRTYSTGIYEIIQKAGTKEIVKAVAVNFPISESGLTGIGDLEGNAGDVGPAADTADTTGKKAESSATSRSGIDLMQKLLIIALLVIIVEWAVYTRQYRA